jgi:hypothetical protein
MTVQDYYDQAQNATRRATKSATPEEVWRSQLTRIAHLINDGKSVREASHIVLGTHKQRRTTR